MRRYLAAICVVGLLGAGAGMALGATPATRASLAGIGGNFWNQGGSWSGHGSGTFSLTTSGRYYTGVKSYFVYIRTFRGSYTTKCNGSHRVAATWIKVQKNGSFSFSFTSHGARVRIWGSFTKPSRAKVNYVVNFSGTNTNPATLNAACATWVRGTAS